MMTDTRRPQRSKSELLDLYQEYQAEPELMSKADWIRHLQLSPSTFNKWQKGIAPKLPGDNAQSRYSHTGKESEDKYEYKFSEIAEELSIEPKEVMKLYTSAMDKIQMIIKNDASYGKTVRQWLDYSEAEVMDHHF